MKRLLSTVALSLVMTISGVAQAPSSVPTVDQILEKYIQALGGRTAFAKVTTRVMVGTWENVTRGLTRPVAIYAKAPNKHIEIMGFGEASRGFNGVVGWSLNMSENGLRELSGTSLAALKREAEFQKETKLKELYSKLTFAGQGKVGDREAYVIEAAPAEGNAEKLYFDTRTGLLVRRDITAEITRDGQSVDQAAAEVYLEDYREVDGIKLPFTIRRKIRGTSISITFREIKHNVPIEDSQFSEPNP